MSRIGKALVGIHKQHCLAFYIQGSFILAFIAGYVAFLVTFRTQDRSQSILAAFPPFNESSTDVVGLSVSLTAISPADYNVKLLINVESVPDSWVLEDQSINHTFIIGVGNQETVISSAGRFWQFSVTLPMSKGSFDLYPFDSYEAEVAIYVYDGSSFYTSELDLSVTVNKAIVYGYSPSLKQFKHQNQSVNSLLERQVKGVMVYIMKIDRTSVFMLYPVFQIIAFWLISLSFCLYTSVTVLWNKRKIEGPIVAGSIGLIFALPAFRNTAPGSPPIGCTLDVCSFYWAMIFVVICFVGIIVRYLMTAPTPPPNSDIQLLLMKALAQLNKSNKGEEEDEGIKLKDMN